MRKKIFFIIHALKGGGAEKVLIELLKNINREKFSLYVAIFNKGGVYFDEIPLDVQIYDLCKISKYSFFSLQRKLNNLIIELQIDIVLSFLNYTNFLTLMSKNLFGWKQPVIISEHNPLTPYFNDNSHLSWVKKYLTKILYPQANFIIVVSNGIKKELLGVISLKEEKIRVIHNPVDINKIKELAEEPVNLSCGNEFQIVTAGRLTTPKDYVTLLKAIKIVRNYLNVHLSILGEGKDEGMLRNFSLDLGISEMVSFLGFQKNPYKYMAKSDLFILSSLWEGFGNVIVEAMCCKVPVIATDCPYGPGEIIFQGKNGILVSIKNENNLAEAILKIAKDESLRVKMAEAGSIRAEDFDVKKVIKEYEDMFLSLTAIS
ncbi:MAG: glycosyltransferase [Candidatus Schekmanbacteria bacterium]|nr:glycosyltransferase [Candidatus Schekmanbacteria bacterium]